MGSHISRVRSLDLDEWPPGHLAVMSSLGNVLANSLWEARRAGVNAKKPEPTSTQEEKERFIMAKSKREKIKLESTAGTGYFYTTTKNRRTATGKLELKKYDPKVRKHVIFKETKLK